MAKIILPDGTKLNLQVIYDPAGRAKEYSQGEYAFNFQIGCTHGCVYCYGHKAVYKTKEEFMQPVVKKAVIERLRKDCEKLQAAGYTGNIFMSFTCDPYDSTDSETGITRQAIEIIHSHGMHCTILTKGGKRAERDFDLLEPGDKFGTTLTFLRESDRELWEPHAARVSERLVSLKNAHEKGIETFASCEPVIYPDQTKDLIVLASDFVDEFRIGKWNYDKRAKNTNWPVFREDIVKICETLCVGYYIKNDLVEAV